ncbi:MAG TPA: type VI secretion system baseplate subunit TssK [Bryobacteraceae bacterium]|nr:type VI secretion system baseplate subunit TssK [Bryobacteraceae bacterium]
MRILQPVVWSKGTFLSPQHLQVEDRFVESIMQFRMEALEFRPWGFKRLQVHQEALAAGVFSIHEAHGLFPDGLPFDIPACDPAPAARPLAGCFDAGQTTLDIYLAVPDYRESGKNVSMPQRDSETRYIAEVATFRDENTGTSEKPIQLARKNFRFLTEGESRRGAVAMRAARVVRSEGGVFELDAQFTPPLLDFTASGYLISVARRLIEILSAKSSLLAAVRRQKNQSLAEFTTADIANFWLLYTINSHFPLFRHLFETKHGHPEELFAAMLSLASALCTFSLDVYPHTLPVYDHQELAHCLGELDEKLRHLLETVVPSNFVSLPMKLIRPSVYAASGFEDRYLEGTRMFLAIQAEMDEAELIQRVPQLVKICSASHIEHLIRQALSGLELTHVVAPPTTIPIKVDYQYFSLNQAGLAWEAIGRARNIAAYIPGDFHNPQAELIVLLPQDG